jgi:hypothetical protein
MRIFSIVVLALAFIAVRPALAQEIPTTPVEPVTVPITLLPDSLAALGRLSTTYIAGNWDAFYEAAAPIRTAIIGNCTPAAQCPREGNYVLLVWVATLPAQDTPTLLTAVVGPNRGEPYARTVPGISRLFEAFVTDNPAHQVASYYVSKPVPDPLLQQVPTALERFVGPLFETLNRNAGSEADNKVSILSLDEPAAVPAPPIYATVRRVELPVDRGSVEIAVSTARGLTARGADEELLKLDGRLHAQGFGNPPIGDPLTPSIMGLMDGVRACIAARLGAQPCRNLLHQRVTTVLQPRMLGAVNDAQRQSLRDLDSALRAFVDGVKPSGVSAKATLENSPYTHLSLGILSSYATWLDGGTILRAKVDKNTIAAAPFTRALQMVALNYSPWGYQDKTTRRWTPRGAVRPFGAVIYSPDIGVAAGATVMVLNNLGVNAGFGWLSFTRPGSPRDGELPLVLGSNLEVKQKDADGKDTDEFAFSERQRLDPLDSAWARAFFLGVSYNFK